MSKIPKGAAALAKAVESGKSYLIDRRFEEYVAKYGPLVFTEGTNHCVYAGDVFSQVSEIRRVASYDPHRFPETMTLAAGVGYVGEVLRVVELKNGVSTKLAQLVIEGKLIPKKP